MITLHSDHLPLANILTDLSGFIISFSPDVEQFRLNIKPGNSIWQYVLSRDWSSARRDLYEKLLTSKLHGHAVISMAGKDKAESLVEIFTSRVAQANAAEDIILWMLRVPTELEKAKESLSVDSTRLRELLELSADWLWETDHRDVITHVSDFFEVNGTRFSAREFLGLSRFGLVNGHYPIRYALLNALPDSYLAALAARKRFDDLRYEIWKQDSYVGTVSSSGGPFFSPEGRYIGYRGISRDISKDTDIVNRLRESESSMIAANRSLLIEASRRERAERSVVAAIDAEQSRLGKELHDGTAQSLAGINLLLNSMSQPSERADIEARLQVKMLLKKAIIELRVLSRGLDPLGPTIECLTDSVKQIASEYEKHFDVTINISGEEALHAVPETSCVQVFRIISERLRVAARGSAGLPIELCCVAGNENINIEIRDWGAGPVSLALVPNTTAMSHRAGLIGAKIEFQADELTGNRASLSVPLPDR